MLSQKKLRQLLSDDMYGDSQAFVDLNVDESLSLTEALDQVCGKAEALVRDGNLILILSDRYLEKGKLPVHALLATGAVHHHLVEKGLRCDVNIIVETGVARDPHHFACLIGYGATAVYPYLVYQSLHDTATEIVCFRGNMHGGPEPFDGGEASKENTAPVSRQFSKPGPQQQQQQGPTVPSPPKIAHLSGAL